MKIKSIFKRGLAAVLAVGLTACASEPPLTDGNPGEKPESSEQAESYDFTSQMNGDGTFSNPLFADVPDMDFIRVGDAFYMTSTTMHLNPGVPVMKSYDLVNWEIVNYVYDRLGDDDRFTLKNGQNDYASGSWASSVRYDKYDKLYYVEFSCQSTNKSYFFVTEDIENGPWHRTETVKCYDAGLLFVDNEEEQRCDKYIIYSKDVTDPAYTDENGKQVEEYYHKSTCMRTISIDTATKDITLGDEVVLIEYPNYEFPAEGLQAEGVHAYYLNGYYYLFMIQGQGWQRQEICWRSKTLEPESFEKKKVFIGNIIDENGEDYMPFTGVAQGGIVDTADGKWYCMLFEDYGAVGRIPVLMEMKWKDGWPVIGNGGTSADKTVKMPVDGYEAKSIVVPDEFDNGETRKIISDLEDKDITAGITAEELENLIKKGENNNNLIANGDFSDGTNGWFADSCKFAVENEDGENVLKITERGGTVSGPRQIIDVENGKAYRFSFKAKYAGSEDSRRINATLQYNGFDDGKGDTNIFRSLASVDVGKNEWTTISGSFIVPDGADVSRTVFFVENPWEPKTGEEDFYVKDFVLAEDPFSAAVAENEFGYNGSNLKLEWQWNHAPNNNLWSLTEREGYLRLKSGILAPNIQQARNTLTQRTFGPACSAETALEIAGLKDGDVAGLTSFQNRYGFVGVKRENGKNYIVMHRASERGDADGVEIERIPLKDDVTRVYLRVDCDFRDNPEKENPKSDDKAYFYYSLDEGKSWKQIGDTLEMFFDWPHFVGQRFGLFYYSTENLGGYADFDYYHLSKDIIIAE